MNKQNTPEEPRSGNFLAGFLLGVIVLFAFGTRQGRLLMRRLLDSSENLEDLIDGVLEETSLDCDINSSTASEHDSSTIQDVLNKIQSVKKEFKHYFSSEGKALKST